MKIGIIGGTGPAGSGLALRLDVAGYDVVIGSRDRARSIEKVKDLQLMWPSHNLTITGGDNADAVNLGSLVDQSVRFDVE